jgi:hypothetical protein
VKGRICGWLASLLAASCLIQLAVALDGFVGLEEGVTRCSWSSECGYVTCEQGVGWCRGGSHLCQQRARYGYVLYGRGSTGLGQLEQNLIYGDANSQEFIKFLPSKGIAACSTWRSKRTAARQQHRRISCVR